MLISQIICAIADTPSRNEKEKILEQHKDNKVFLRVLKMAYHPYTNFWIKKIPNYTASEFPQLSLSEALDALELLSDRTYTGNAAIAHLQSVLENVFSIESSVIRGIIERDLRCGITATTINKIIPGLIPSFDVMLAHKDISGIHYPAYAQCKYDGGRIHLYFDGVRALATTRNGKSVELHGALDDAAKALMKAGEVFDGELVFYENNKPMDRKTSNGLLSKGIKGTLSVAEAAKVRMHVWDIVDFTSTIRYEDRFNELESRFSIIKVSAMVLAETVVVNSHDEAMIFYQGMLGRGEEGAILKNFDSKWVPKRSKDIGKLKAEEEADLVVVGYQTGTGKYTGKLGAITVSTSDGKLRTSVGTGFSDDERLMTPEDLLDKIVTVRYNMKIKDKKSEYWSLFLPRYVEIRYDKNVANTLEELK